MIVAKRDLAREANARALAVRKKAGYDYESPLCVYELCARLGLRVRFDPINMEGVYRQDGRLIVLSSLRPIYRRAFTCAHEVGHDTYGHAGSIDELVELTGTEEYDEEEFIVDAFAGILLMPPVGVAFEFGRRGWKAATATPVQIFTIACVFGVGYVTFVNHLAYGLRMISHYQATQLKRVTLPEVRRRLLGLRTQERDRLVLADEQYSRTTIDAEVGAQVVVPAGAIAASPSKGCSPTLDAPEDHGPFRSFTAVRPGIVRVHVPGTPWAIFVRVSRYQYTGWDKFRHLELRDDDEEDGDGDQD